MAGHFRVQLPMVTITPPKKLHERYLWDFHWQPSSGSQNSWTIDKCGNKKYIEQTNLKLILEGDAFLLYNCSKTRLIKNKYHSKMFLELVIDKSYIKSNV